MCHLCVLGCHGDQTGNKKWSDPAVYLSQASSREEMVQSAQSSQTLRTRTSKTLRGSSSPAAQVRAVWSGRSMADKMLLFPLRSHEASGK